MRSPRPWCFSHPTTAVTSRERNCSWTAVSHRCRPSMAERHGTNSKHPRRRLAARRAVAAYGRTVQRCLLLILIASAPFLIGERPQSWDVLGGAGALAHTGDEPNAFATRQPDPAPGLAQGH